MTTTNDREWMFLAEQTGVPGPFNDMYFNYLRGLGYTGTLQDMIAAYGYGLTPSKGEVVPTWLTDLNPDAVWGVESITDGRSYGAGPISETRASSGWARNLAGVWSQFSTNVPRITDRGWMLEPAETNYATYGTAPENWSTSAPGLTIVKTAITMDGLPGVRIAVSGTANADGEIAINPVEFNAGATAAQGQTWRASARIRKISGTLPTTSRVGLFERDAASGLLSAQYSSSFNAVGSTSEERKVSFQFANAAAARAHTSIRMSVTNAQAYNFIIEITDAHLSRYVPFSSPVLSVGVASATRAIGSGSLPIPAGSWDVHVVFADTTPEQVFSGVSGPNWQPNAAALNSPEIAAIYGVAI